MDPTLGTMLARRNAIVLALAQAFIGAAAPVAISTGGLAGLYLLGADKSLATLPVTGFNVGVALGALPAAALMRMVGRRLGFVSGTLSTGAGGLLAALGLFLGSFWLFAAALVLIGVGNAFTQQYRFAATDGAPVAYHSNAISIVLMGGIAAAVIGPQTVRFFASMFEPVEFAGAFVALIGLALCGALALSALRPPPAAASIRAGDADAVPPRALREIVTQRSFLVALVVGTGTFSLMTFVMTGAPLAIVGCGFSRDVSYLGIQWHVLAMFGPSFVTGRLINRFGAEAVVASGLVLTALSAFVFLGGEAVWNFWFGLVLLGAGWNFGFIGSTTMVARTHRPSEKARTQGFHDFVLFTCVAIASFFSGKVYVAFGWQAMNWIVLPIAAICLLTLLTDVLLRRREQLAA